MNYESLVPITGIIRNISQSPNNCCNQTITINTPQGINNFVLSPETAVVGSAQLRTGMPVAAFYDSTKPVPLIYPPQFQTELITPLQGDEILSQKPDCQRQFSTLKSLPQHKDTHFKRAALFLSARRKLSACVLLCHDQEHSAPNHSQENNRPL